MKKNKGFTLVEIMVGMLLAAIISIAGFEFFRYVKKFAVESKAALMAANLARETMEYYYFATNLVANGQDVQVAILPSEYLPSASATRYYNYSVSTSTNANYDILRTRVEW